MKVKTSFLLIALICFSAATVAAQKVEVPVLKSVKGGFVISSFQNSGLETDTKPGFVLGLAFDFRLYNRFSIHPEVMYVEKGGTVTDPSLDTDFVLSMDYVEFPVLARYYLYRAGPAEFHISAGPYVSALIATTSSTEVMEEGLFTPDELIEEAQSAGWGIMGSVGTDFYFPFNTTSVEIRFARGLSKAFDSATDEKSVLQHFSLLVGFSF